MKQQTPPTSTEYVEPLGFKGSPGQWFITDGWNEKGEGKYFPSVIVSIEKYNRGDKTFDNAGGITINESHDQERESIMANAKIIASAKSLAKALQDMVKLVTMSDMAFSPQNVNAKQVLKQAGLTE